MPAELLPLTAETLHKFDGGRIALALDAALEAAVADLVNRPGDGTKRTICLKIELTPECDAANNLEAIELDANVTAKVPCYRVRPNKLTARKLRGKDVIIFNPDDNDSRQLRLDMEDE